MEQITTTQHPRIAILMATYNGERFLAEQIGSILGQTNHDFTSMTTGRKTTRSTSSTTTRGNILTKSPYWIILPKEVHFPIS